jgi:protein-tyrosine phosphatase
MTTTTTLDQTIIRLADGKKPRPPKKSAQILDWLWLGDQNAAFNGLAAGYSHIISCVNQQEMDLIRGFWDMHEYLPQHLHILVEDHPSTQITQYYKVIADWLSEQHKQNFQSDSNKTMKCLIHCQAGVNRSASLAIMIYCATKNCQPSTAGEAIWHLRPGILTNSAFRRQIDEWYI